MISKTKLKSLLSYPGLYITSACFQLLGVALLWPVFGGLVQWWLSWTGEPAVTDQAIAGFLLSPMGALGGLISVTLGLCILALEQTGLIAQILAFNHGYQVQIVKLIRYSFHQFGQTFLLVLMMLFRALIWMSPFLILLAGVAWWLLSEHDINFYLAERPAEFYWAIGLAAVIVIFAVFILLPIVSSWSLALPVMLIQSVSPRQALRTSRQVIGGRTLRVAGVWLAWIILQLVLASLLVSIVFGVARLAVSTTQTSLTLLVPILGLFAGIWLVGNFLLSLFRSVSFAVLGVQIFESMAKLVPANNADETSIERGKDENYFLRLGGQRKYLSAEVIDEGVAKRSKWLVDVTSRNILIAVACLGIVSTGIGLWLLSSVKTVENVAVIAHRGASAYAPENSMAAFERAIAMGADFVELDVQESADGEVVVFHDQDFMKSSGRPNKIWETNYQQMLDFDIGSRFDQQYSDQRVPTLAEVLQLCKDRIDVMIELKYYGHDQQLVQRVAEIVEHESMVDQIVIMSLKPHLVRDAKLHRPDWTVGLLAAVAVGDLTKTDYDFLAVNASMATRTFIARAKRRGVLVYVWTVNDPAAMAHCLSLGVDGIITDKPDIARQVIEQYQSLGLVDRLLLDTAIRLGVVPVIIQPGSEEDG